MTVAELITALEALGPDAQDLPVVVLDDYGPNEPGPYVDGPVHWQRRNLPERWVVL